MSWDYIIVGQGLAGSVLSHTLISQGKRVLVLDDTEKPQATQFAAGIYNPFTGRKMVPTWMLSELFPFLHRYYATMGQDLQQTLGRPLAMFRPFLSIKEQNEWGSKAHDQGYRDYIHSILSASEAPKAVKCPWGGLLLKNTGYIDTAALVGASRNYLTELGCFKPHKFDYAAMEVKRDSITYQNEQAHKIIFCEGPNLLQNPYFKWLPLRPVKGETLLVELPESLPYIINRGIFVLPINESVCKVGATFEHSTLNWEQSEEGKMELETKLQKLINLPYKVVDQQAGIRPATKDRRPFIGLHPQYEPLGIFNGLGTKGVSLAPYFAQEFFEFLEQGKPLLNDVSINRYF